MTKEEVLKELESYGNENTKRIFINHGAREPFFGVKVQDLKKIVKKIKKDYHLSLELFDSGNSDAMYLAGLIADESQMTKADLKKWAKGAYWYMISEYTVAWIASESQYGLELALEWIESDKKTIAAAGWSTLSNLMALKADDELDIQLLKDLLLRVKDTIHEQSNRVKYTMNGFVISVGAYVSELTDLSMQTAEKIGKVEVFMGKTSCKVPFAPEYLQKIIDKGRVGKKKKTARC
ncbi:DNA alkylation repair protein [Marinifilum sp. N1E240]|uniref:DNA alkylation repair protein n=1 Tax=Marinifilum sp. N1E240 TaxID=2608082 RepID=UPI00128B16A9|nr:DNA alkylation repair protein [Marinifilum sp. N1E240]MPQ46725.1 DNA alkylation repair protein [Marinifilum sp. N1E240]